MLAYKNVSVGALVITTLLHFGAAQSEPDMPGSRDHPKIPRVADTTIVGFAESSYDEGAFMTGASGRKMISEHVEGKRTRIIYRGPKGLSPLGILRNYQNALSDLGKVEEVFSCRSNTCFSNLGGIFIWQKNNRIPTAFTKNEARYLYHDRGSYRDQSYWYGTVISGDVRYHVSIYSAVMTGHAWTAHPFKDKEGHSLTHLEIVEEADFEPTLEFVKAEEMSAKISETGHIALYGIYFDFDSDRLKPESDATLEQIAKALEADPALNIYVVGHTDNKGTLEYNEDLSKRRAAAVANMLNSKYGIANERLIPVGAGLIAPVATNRSEEGRALNRRVELVER